MPYIYHNTSVVNGNVHILTLQQENQLILTLQDDTQHNLVLTTPVVRDGGGGTADYDQLYNKPIINNRMLQGSMTLEYLGIQPAGNYPNSPLTDEDLEILIGNEI